MNLVFDFPNAFDVGIAEEHAVCFAGGLAAGGSLPVFAVYSTFLQRGYDQIIHDVAIQNVKVGIRHRSCGYCRRRWRNTSRCI